MQSHSGAKVCDSCLALWLVRAMSESVVRKGIVCVQPGGGVCVSPKVSMPVAFIRIAPELFASKFWHMWFLRSNFRPANRSRLAGEVPKSDKKVRSHSIWNCECQRWFCQFCNFETTKKKATVKTFDNEVYRY